VDGDFPGGLRHLRSFQMSQLIRRHGEKAGGRVGLIGGFAFRLLQLTASRLE